VDESGPTTGDSPARRIPVLTIALIIAAVAFPFVYSATAGDQASFGWMLIGPPTFGATGAVIAWRARAFKERSRRGWAAASLLTGLFTVPVVYITATLIEAIDWTINGPPF
jgi:uncharacterized membrane protein